MTWVARVPVSPDWSGATQGRPRSHADGSRTGPERPKTAPEVFRGAQTRQGRISKRFGSEPGSPGTSKNLTKCCTVDDFRGFRHLARKPSTEVQNAPKGAPREAQMSPRRAQDRPRRGPKDASREPFGSPFWPHLGAPGASFSSLLGVLFEPRARSARQTKTLFEITGQKVFRDRCGPDVQRPLSTKLLN